MNLYAEQIIHILPRIPPAACGVADYAWSLARRMRDSEGFGSCFLGVNQAEHLIERQTEFSSEVLKHPSSTALIAALSERIDGTTCLLLHFSPYGFQKRGVPLWLAQAWAGLAQRNQKSRRIVMFHEVAATSSPRNSAFWLRPLQQFVARRLFVCSDTVLTNSEFNKRELQLALRRPIQSVHTLPVFSNFGEPLTSLSPCSRERQIVLFTSNLSAQHGHGEIWKELECAAQQVGANRVVLIGENVSTPADLAVSVKHTGFLKPDEVSKILTQSAFGFAFVAPNRFAKSGVFAAFAAHGVIPIVPVSDSTLPDDLCAGTHYVRSNFSSDLKNLTALQYSLQGWYAKHSLGETAHFYAWLLNDFSSQGSRV